MKLKCPKAIALAAWTALALTLACDEAPQSQSLASASPTSSTGGVVIPVEPSPSQVVPPSPEAVLLISDPEALAKLERAGYGFSQLLFDKPHASSAELSRDPRFPQGRLPRGPRGCKASSISRAWFDREDVEFDLVGVVNRLDQRDLRPKSCGETRLVYRGVVRGGPGESDRRLPLVFNAVFDQQGSGTDCREVAQSWFTQPGHEVEELTQRGRPLALGQFSRESLVTLELNVRAGEDESGAACNELRSFVMLDGIHLRDDRTCFGPSSCGQRFNAGSLSYPVSQRAKFVRWLMVPVILAEVVAGVPPTGGIRNVGKKGGWGSGAWFRAEGTGQPYRAPSRFNELGEGSKFDVGPYSAAMRPDYFEDLPLPESLPTPKAVLQRLDGMTCAGCHRQRAVGGFHLPGSGGQSSLTQAASPHLRSQLAWRRDYVHALAQGVEPERRRGVHNASDGPGREGDHCSRAGASRQDMHCADDLECIAAQGFDFGVCWPPNDSLGAPCTETDGPSCRPPGPWLPGGYLESNQVGQRTKLVLEEDLRACAKEDAPWTCAEERASTMALRACDDGRCRDGYVCVEAGPNEKVCMPVASLREFRVLAN